MDKVAVGSYIVKPEIPIGSYQAEYDAQAAAGRRLAFVEAHTIGSAVRVSAIWYSAIPTQPAASHGMNQTQAAQTVTSNMGAGRFTRSISGYVDGGLLRYIGLWRAAPDTWIPAGPSGTTASTTASFSFKVDHPLSIFECSLDSGAYVACTSPKSYTGLSRTTHTFRVRAKDRQGVLDATPATRTWTVS
jgi:hypothetical protein